MDSSICLEQEQTVQTVVQGANQTLNVRLVDATSGDPLDLSNVGEIVAVFPSTQAPLYFEKKYSMAPQITIASAAGGRILILLSPADTMLLTPGASISFEVRITIAGIVSAVQLISQLNVVPSLFPTAP